MFGRVGIDLAGPRKQWSLLMRCRCRNLCYGFIRQAEHGYNSPAVLLTNSRNLAEQTLAEIDRILKILPTSDTAEASWENYGEVILCDTYEEMLQVADEVASEHVQVMTDRDDWFLKI